METFVQTSLISWSHWTEGQHRRRWASISPASVQRLLFVGYVLILMWLETDRFFNPLTDKNGY